MLLDDAVVDVERSDIVEVVDGDRIALGDCTISLVCFVRFERACLYLAAVITDRLCDTWLIILLIADVSAVIYEVSAEK